jgi:hypothetical protein
MRIGSVTGRPPRVPIGPAAAPRRGAPVAPAPLRAGRLVGALVVLSLLGGGHSPPARAEAGARVGSAETAAAGRVPAAVHATPAFFVENAGEPGADARFTALGATRALRLAEDGLRLAVLAPPPPVAGRGGPPEQVGGAEAPPGGVDLRLSFSGANTHPRLEGVDPQRTAVSVLLGDDPTRWRAGLPAWGGVRYVDLYPGVDLEILAQAGGYRQRLAVRAPSAEALAALRAARLRVEGAAGLALTPDGALRIRTDAGEVTVALPVVDGIGRADLFPVRETGGPADGPAVEGFEVSRPFRWADGGAAGASGAGAAAGPDLAYATYLGGNGVDEGRALALDPAGNVYVTGYTSALNLPATPGAFQTGNQGGYLYYDVFVAKLTPSGSVVYVTYLGGNGNEIAFGVAADAAGSAYVVGHSNSGNFPISGDAPQPRFGGGGYDAFVTKLSPAGDAVVYSSFLGGGDWDEARGVAVDGEGNAYVAGYTRSADFPTTPGAFQAAFGGGRCVLGQSYTCHDAFVTKVNAAGTGLVYSTYLGAGGDNRDDQARAVAVDGAGSAYVTGFTQSPDFPTTAGAWRPAYGGAGAYAGPYGDAFATKLDPGGGALAYSTFLGGSASERGLGIAVDGAGSAYVAGTTQSADFPTTAGAFAPALQGYNDVFVAKLNCAGSAPAYSTYLRSPTGGGLAIAVGGGGRAYVATENADAVVVGLSAAGDARPYAARVGGSGADGGYGIGVDAAGALWVTGFTYSSDFPTTPGAYQAAPGGGGMGVPYWDAFVAKLVPPAQPPAAGAPPPAGQNRIYLPLLLRPTSPRAGC